MEIKLLELIIFVTCIALGSCFLLPEEQLNPHRSGGRMPQQRRANELAKLLRELKTRKDKRSKQPFTLLNSGSSTADCRVDPFERLDCGDLTREECSDRGCCWKESVVPGAPWCFHSVSNSRGICAIEPKERTDCGFYGVTSDQCRRAGCCWSPTQVAGAPWCFYTSDSEDRTQKVRR